MAKRSIRVQAAQLLEQITATAETALDEIKRIQDDASKRIDDLKRRLKGVQDICPHKKLLPAQGPVQLFVTCAECGAVLEN